MILANIGFTPPLVVLVVLVILLWASNPQTAMPILIRGLQIAIAIVVIWLLVALVLYLFGGAHPSTG